MEGTIKKLRDYVLSVYIPVCLCISLVIIGSFYSVYTVLKQNDFSQEINFSVKNINNDLENSRDALLIKYLSISNDELLEDTNTLFTNKIDLINEDIQVFTNLVQDKEIYTTNYNGKTLSYYTDEIKLILNDYSRQEDFKTGKDYFNYLNSLYTKMQTDVIEIENITSSYNTYSNNQLKEKLILAWTVIIILLVIIITAFIKKSMKFEDFLSKKLEELHDNAKKIIDGKTEEVKFEKVEKDEKIFEKEPDEFSSIKEAIIETSTRVDEFKGKTKHRVSKLKNETLDFTEEKDILKEIKNMPTSALPEETENILEVSFKDTTAKSPELQNIDLTAFEENFNKVLEDLNVEESGTDNSEEIEKLTNRISFLALTAVNEAKEAGANGMQFELVAQDLFNISNKLFKIVRQQIEEKKEIKIDTLPVSNLFESLKEEICKNEEINKENVNVFAKDVENIILENKEVHDILIQKLKEKENMNKEVIILSNKLNEELDSIKESASILEDRIKEKEDKVLENTQKNEKIIKEILNY